ncbi:glycosyltransferase family 4 protein [Bradyrhizobium sp. SYSU BS000235]|uniref:glycosyltransferase family 4 protein n=1 Tax=Bradyrhizobium sp. SYSU BS000235 TaxID=3411332 RepID=UPI003C75C77D
MKHFVLAAPGDLDTPTGGFAYDRRIILELRDLGWDAQYLNLGEGFPFANEVALRNAESQLFDVPVDYPIVLDGLALGVLPQVAAKLANRNPLLALVHHPLALEWGLSGEQAAAFRSSEQSALAHVRKVVVTSATTARLVEADYGVRPERITVVIPGSDPVPPSVGSESNVPHLLSVGAIVPRKGFDVLIASLATLTDLSWRLTIVGDLTRDPNETAKLRESINRHGLGDRVAMRGAVPPEQLAELYHKADAFVLASRFEGYGMAYAEALSRGLPIVGTTAGAISQTVPGGAGVLVTAGDTGALTAALKVVISDGELRCRMSRAALASAAKLPTWRDSGAAFARVLEKFA